LSYTEAPVTADALTYIFWHLWPRGLEELGRLGLPPLRAMDRFLAWAQDGRSGVLLHNGVPVLASGIVPIEGEFVTWFIATEAFQKHWLKITRLLKRECSAHPKPLRIYSVTVHPATAKWFKALGFEQDDYESRTAADWPLYRFTRT
jgi:hypothetical protein